MRMKLLYIQRCSFTLFFCVVQPSDNEQEEEEEEMDQSKLRRLKSLLSKHMGNTEIPEKTLIRIVDLMDQLNI